MGVITVKGRGYVSAQPDVVTLSFTTGSKARDYAECVDSLNGRTAVCLASRKCIVRRPKCA